jgi:hypothetical protein
MGIAERFFSCCREEEDGGAGVAAVEAEGGSAAALVVCLGKPLVRRLLGRREQHELLAKHALGALGARPHLARRPGQVQRTANCQLLPTPSGLQRIHAVPRRGQAE